jgi:hypothetical protein
VVRDDNQTPVRDRVGAPGCRIADVEAAGFKSAGDVRQGDGAAILCGGLFVRAGFAATRRFGPVTRVGGHLPPL